MAIKIQKKIALNAVRFVSENDDSHDKGNDEAEWKETVYKKYLETLNPDDLKFLPDTQPTIFLCNFEVNAAQSAEISDSIMRGKDQVAIGTWSQAVVRNVLKDIINPDYVPLAERIPFKKNGKGGVHDETMALMVRYGFAQEIFAVYNEKTGEFKQSAKN
jgi:hypothetical protein